MTGTIACWPVLHRRILTAPIVALTGLGWQQDRSGTVHLLRRRRSGAGRSASGSGTFSAPELLTRRRPVPGAGTTGLLHAITVPRRFPVQRELGRPSGAHASSRKWSGCCPSDPGEGLRGSRRCGVDLVAGGVDPGAGDGGDDGVAEFLRVVAADREAGAVVGAVVGERADDERTSRRERFGETAEVGGAVGGIGEEVEDGAVVPQVPLACRCPGRGCLSRSQVTRSGWSRRRRAMSSAAGDTSRTVRSVKPRATSSSTSRELPPPTSMTACGRLDAERIDQLEGHVRACLVPGDVLVAGLFVAVVPVAGAVVRREVGGHGSVVNVTPSACHSRIPSAARRAS